MARYFFNVRDGDYLLDDTGEELASFEEAQVQAVELAGSLLREGGAKFWNGSEWVMEVCDATGLILFTLTFAATLSAAPPKRRPPTGRR